MRRLARLLPMLVLVLVLGLAPAGAGTALLGSAPGVSPVVQVPLGNSAFVSENVTYLGTIPIEAIGGQMLECGEQKLFFVTGVPGLVIYDVTDPALPLPVGALPVPHFQNENVAVADDCSRVIISTDTANAGPNPGGTVSAGTGSIRVIDTTDPFQPSVTGHIAQSNHTSMCADPGCNWIYGSSGRIYRVDENGQIFDNGNNWGSGGHALERDTTGLIISDSSPRRVLDVTGDFIEGSTPANPGLVAVGPVGNIPGLGSDRLQHNNVRPNADEWEPRDPEAPDFDDPALRPGELLIGNSESNVQPSCGNNAGGLSTWTMANFDRGVDMRRVEMFRPVNGNWADGNPAVNALGCSGHWFTVRDHMIAAAWYEHGLRFVEVDPETGKFTQRGFFNPVVTEMGSAHWTTDEDGNEYVYTTDYARGVDIVRFDRDGATPDEAVFDASWLAKVGVELPNAAAERLLCRIGAQPGR